MVGDAAKVSVAYVNFSAGFSPPVKPLCGPDVPPAKYAWVSFPVAPLEK